MNRDQHASFAEDTLGDAPHFLDNRPTTFHERAQALSVRRLRWPFGDHFKFAGNGKTIIYCYIRKNACTAFKNLICDRSQFHELMPKYRREFDFMVSHHSVKSKSDFAAADHIMFVYRDPLERTISLFRSKFIIREGNEDIFRNYREVTGCDPNTASFNEFVCRYLTKGHARLDPHCRSQHSHLLPIFYTDAVPINELRHRMDIIIGKSASAAYFGRKINSSAGMELEGDLHAAPASVLHQQYRGENRVPSLASLLSDQVVATIQKIYADDFAMIDRISAHCRRP